MYEEIPLVLILAVLLLSNRSILLAFMPSTQRIVVATAKPNASNESVATAARTPASPRKKKVSKNNTAKKTTSNKGGTKTTKKRVTTASRTGNEVSDVEIEGEQQSKTSLQRIHVKQRSIDDSSTVAGRENSALVVDKTGGLASGQYGTILETKRAEKLCLSLGLQTRYVEALHRAFKREEQLGTGEITTGEFFSMIHEQPRQLTKGIFEAVGLASDLRKMRFDDFVLCVVTVATWSKSELLYYAFKQFDVDESGVMDGRELRAFCEGLKNDSSFYFAKNVNTAREKLGSRDQKSQNNQSSSRQLQITTEVETDVLVDLEDIVKGSTEFQVAFYPLIQLQQNVRACSLGETFWGGVMQRRQQVELVVQYMMHHKGKLPPISSVTRIVSLIPFSQAHTKVLIHKLAVLKYAEDQRQLLEESSTRAKAKQALRLAQVEEEN